GRLAQQAAQAYGANFNLATRNKLHYLDILPPCARMVGDGSQYFHAHTFGFHKSCQLHAYQAVFGGLFADALLKGARIKKYGASGRFPFLPQIKKHNPTSSNPLKSSIFTGDVLTEVAKRQKSHLNVIKGFRKRSAEEWFALWPSSMNMNIPNWHANRRLFR